MAVDGAREGADPPLSAADPFDSPRFARTYIITFWMELVGPAAFVGGMALASFTSIGPVLVMVGGIAFVVGIIASTASAYRVLRLAGHTRYYAWIHSGPESVPSWSRHKAYRALRRLSSPSERR
jgi:hypothetical protein